MKIKKQYTFTNNRQIWRVIPADSGKLIIEDRDTEAKEAFFNCIDIESGKDIFRNYQFEEKYWIGIEIVHKDIIYFYKYAKPDMPRHKGVIAFDIYKQEIIWENNDYSFLFIRDEEIFCYTEKFEGRNFFTLNCLSGKLMSELGNNAEQVNLLKNGSVSQSYEGYKFPQNISYLENSPSLNKILQDFRTDYVVIGQPEYLEYDNLLLISSFEPNDNGSLNNIFRAIDIVSGKVIFEEVLNNHARTPVPESFFLKNNLIFLLKEKTKLLVCAVKT